MENESEKDFLIPQSLSAMAAKFYVKVAKPLTNQDIWYLKQGSMVTGVKVIAEGTEIREVERLRRDYPLPNGEKTKAKDWFKVRGTALITDGTNEVVVELHWYQCKNIRRVEYKQKVKSAGGVIMMMLKYNGDGQKVSFVKGVIYKAKKYLMTWVKVTLFLTKARIGIVMASISSSKILRNFQV